MKLDYKICLKRSSEYPTRSLNTIIEEDEDEYLEQEAKTQNQFIDEVDFTTPEMETEIKQRESVSSNSSGFVSILTLYK